MFGLNPDGRNIFLITTPFQFILANLIKDEFKLEAELIVVTDLDKSLEQIDESAKYMNVNNYRKMFKSVPLNEHNKFKLLYKEVFRYASMLKLKASFKRHDNVFVGLATSPINRPIVCGHKDYNLVFFDDGTATIRFLRKRETGEKNINFPKSSLLHFYTKFYPRFATLNEIVYYTIYPGLRGGKNDTVVQVKANLPSRLIKNKSETDEIWFIGGPLVERRVIPDDIYAREIKNILKVCHDLNLKFVYFSHRVEKWIYENFPEMEIRQPSLPWELFFALSEEKPKAIVSIMSSVIVNLSILSGQICQLIYLDIDHIGENGVIKEMQDYAKRVLKIPVISSRGELKLMIFGEE